MESNNNDPSKEVSLKSTLPETCVINYDKQSLNFAAQNVYSILGSSDHPLHIPIYQAVTILEEGLKKFDLENICICFNGGKDCTALLHLFYAVVQKNMPHQLDYFNGLCIRSKCTFIEMDEFIKEASSRYNLKLWTYDDPIQAGLQAALTEHPEIKAVLMGTRRSDPSGQNLNPFQMTDKSWPQVMRISPLLDWSYDEVWMFLRLLSVPYCSLYNEGYTSIGSKNNSFPNPELLINGEETKQKYRPAYELNNSVLERSGRM